MQTLPIRTISLAILLTGLVCGCSWMPFVGKGDHEKKSAKELQQPAKLVKFKPAVRVRRQWSASIGDGLGKKYLRIRPAVAADRIFVADGYGLVEVRQRFTGKRIWRTRIGPNPFGLFSAFNIINRRDPSYLTGAVGLAFGDVLLGTTAGDVIALSAADGKELWRVNVGSEVLAPPVGGADLVFVRTIDGRLLALEHASGKVRWSIDNQVPVLTLRGTGTPVYDDGVVYAGFANGMLMAVRADNGQPIWQQRIMLPEGRSELERMVDVDSTPVVDNGIVYVAAFQGRVKALRASDGSMLWEKDMGSHVDLASGFSQIYVVTDDDEIIAIDKRTAQEAWHQNGLYRRKLSGPIAFGNYLVVCDGSGYVHVLAQSDGRFLGRTRVDGGIRSRPVVADDLFYVLANSGKLEALKIELKSSR